MMRKVIALTAAVTAASLLTTGARATPTYYTDTNAGSFTTTDTVNWATINNATFGDGLTLSSPVSATASNTPTLTVTGTTENNQVATGYLEGSITGGFAGGADEALLYMTDVGLQQSRTITLAFSSPVTGLLLQGEPAAPGDYAVSMTIYYGCTTPGDIGSCQTLTTQSDTVSSAGFTGPGTPAYVGVDDGVADIYYATIGTTDPAASADGFAIGLLSLNTTGSQNNEPGPPSGTPEPATVALFGAGLLALAAARRRKI